MTGVNICSGFSEFSIVSFFLQCRSIVSISNTNSAVQSLRRGEKQDKIFESHTISTTMKLTTALACSLFAGHPKRGQAQQQQQQLGGMGNPATINCVNQNFTDQMMYAPDGGKLLYSPQILCGSF